jgi:DME family drug/metabolite transporter
MTKSTSARAGFGFIVIASILFGTTGTAQQIADLSVSGLYVGAARQVIGGIALVLLALALGNRDLRHYFLSQAGVIAALGTLLYQVTFFIGISSNGVAVGTVVALGSAPMFTALLSKLVLGEPIKSVQVQVFILVLVGIWLLMVGFSFRIELSLAMLASLAAGLGYAIYTVGAKQMIVAGADSTTALAVAFGGAVPIAIIILIAGDWDWLTSSVGFFTVLYLGLVPTAIAYYFFGRGLAVLPTASVATITLIEPVFAAILAIMILNESFFGIKIVGTVLVLLGLLILGRVESRSIK